MDPGEEDMAAAAAVAADEEATEELQELLQTLRHQLRHHRDDKPSFETKLRVERALRRVMSAGRFKALISEWLAGGLAELGWSTAAGAFKARWLTWPQIETLAASLGDLIALSVLSLRSASSAAPNGGGPKQRRGGVDFTSASSMVRRPPQTVDRSVEAGGVDFKGFGRRVQFDAAAGRAGGEGSKALLQTEDAATEGAAAKTLPDTKVERAEARRRAQKAKQKPTTLRIAAVGSKPRQFVAKRADKWAADDAAAFEQQMAEKRASIKQLQAKWRRRQFGPAQPPPCARAHALLHDLELFSPHHCMSAALSAHNGGRQALRRRRRSGCGWFSGSTAAMLADGSLPVHLAKAAGPAFTTATHWPPL